jgi:ribosome-binding protein aMBF1 (putative translation factor)
MKALHYPTLFKYARQSLGLNQKEMAERLLVNQSTVSKIESGRHCPHRGTLLRMVRLTGLSMEVLTDRATTQTEQLKTGRSAGRPAIRYKAEDVQVARFRQNELHKKLKQKLHKRETELQKLEAQRYMHDLAEEHALQKLSEAKEVRAHLQQTAAPADLLYAASKTEQEAAAHLALLHKKGIHLPTGYELLLMEAEIKQLRARIGVLINN